MSFLSDSPLRQSRFPFFFFFNDTATTEIYTLSLHDALPITHVEQVRTPVLIMVGDNDTRCPLQQVLNYAKRLEEYGKRFELDRFDAGHGALVTEERIRQTGLLLDFGARHVPGVHPAER